MSLLDRLDEDFAEPWKPETPNEQIWGRITEIGRNDNGYGEYTIVTIRVEGCLDGNKKDVKIKGERRAIHCFGTVLKGEVDKREMKIGGDFAVRYEGEKTSKNGNKFQSYRVAYEPPNVASKLDDDFS